MHDHGLRLGEGETFAVQAEEPGVLADARKHRLALALVLDAEEIDHIGVGQCFVQIIGHPTAHFLKHPRYECAGAAERDVGAELAQGPDVGAGHAAVKNVAKDGYVEAGDGAFLFTNGEHIEEGLSGVLVSPVTGVHHVGVEKAREEVRRTGGLVADDNDVRIQRLEIACGVFQAFPFLKRGRIGGEVDDIRTETLGRELEAHTRASGGFDKEVHDRLAL